MAASQSRPGSATPDVNRLCQRAKSIAKVTNGKLRSLDLLDAKVRYAVRTFEGGEMTALYESASATDYQ